jgi:hypothetical protein
MPDSSHRLLAALALLSAVVGARSLSSPPVPTMLVVHVVDSASRRPLVNAEVTAAQTRRLADADGNARFPWPEDGTLKIRVRQIGFRYAERTVHRGSSATARADTVVVAMRTAAFALPQMAAVADPRCDSKPDSAALALSTSTMELLRFGAEQYDTFRQTYPFYVSLNRRTVRSAVTKGSRAEERKEVAESDTYCDPYQPGQAIQRIPEGLYIPVLFVTALADSAFLNRHCFDAKGVETRENRRVIRLDFNPARGVRETEWAGTAWIDSAASVLRRVDFHLVNIRGRGAPLRYEGYTTFAIPSPFIAVPDSTIAWWWTETKPSPSDDKFTADVLQFLTTRELAYKREKPPVAH